MKKKILILTLLLSIFAVGCDRQNVDQRSVTSELSIMTNVGSSSEVWCDLSDQSDGLSLRAVSTRINVDNNIFEAGDKIGLYLVEWAGATAASQVKTNLESAGNQTDNHNFTYVTTPSNSWTAVPLTNPLTWRKVSFFAYHPYNAAITDALQVPFTVRTDQRTGIVSADYLMWGIGAANDAGYTPATDINPVVLDFKHKTAHVDLKVTLPSMFNGIEIVSIDGAQILGVPVTGNKINLQSGVLTVSTTAADLKPVSMFKKAGAAGLSGDFSAVITPTTIAAGREIIKIDYTGVLSSGSLYFYAGAAGFTFVENNRYTITLSTEEFGFAADLPVFVGDVETNLTTFIVRSSGAAQWTVTSGDPSWITVSKDAVTPAWVTSFTGSGDNTCRVKVLKNTTGRSRMNKITLSATGEQNVELVVFQQANTI